MVLEDCVLDTSVLIELVDRGREDLLEEIIALCNKVLIPWIVVYEYLYGHKYVGRSISKRKEFLEKLGATIWGNQEILLKALEIDVQLHKTGKPIPFSDILIASIALTYNARLLTMDEKHFSRIKGLKIKLIRRKAEEVKEQL